MLVTDISATPAIMDNIPTVDLMVDYDPGTTTIMLVAKVGVDDGEIYVFAFRQQLSRKSIPKSILAMKQIP